ncbi:fused MFS/spermidine synthase [Nocardioides sp. 616]|uniref:spermidine synthase n=1 Tax=Nocardioides sp. 616 TaxID=2268090 RepID=UPI000CE3B71B|nr:fused MFS/spermidine synthase [Nocardioides sp. 616]
MVVEVQAPSTGPTASPPPLRHRPGLTLLFALTSFVGASLLFVVQPMVARMLLPHFGGSASVWSTSSLFFQVLLLGGYLYVHLTTGRLGRRVQPVLHLGVLLVPLLVLPVALPQLGDVTSSPVARLLWALALMIGLPFVVISTTGPLLQRWYSWTGLQRSEDPYFLFATSNLGSFGGLLAYPFLIEPFLRLDQQRTWWSWGFVVFGLLMATCGLQALRGARASVAVEESRSEPLPAAPSGPRHPAPTGRTVGWWLFLAFLPSTLMLSVTSHISTDVAAIPLMWVVPLAIYLATFVVAFARGEREPGPWVLRLAVVIAAGAALVSLSQNALPIVARLGVDLVLLGAGAYAAHARLAATRPHPDHLTRFYLVVAAGGALGGLLNGVLAPMFFDRVWEYPMALAGMMLLGLGTGARPRGRYHPAFALALQSLALGVALLVIGKVGISWGAERGWPLLLVVAAAAVLAAVASLRPGALAVAVVGALVVAEVASVGDLYRDRTFYGSYRVEQIDDKRVFVHGTTVHGVEITGPGDPQPISYYGPRGPVGELFAALPAPDHVAVVGLGVGTFASYVGAGQELTFYEIDPEVVRVAENPELFTFLSSTEADVRQVVGDGRLSLQAEAPGSVDLLVLDAFSSDAIPVHLLTREAFGGYADALAEDGVLLVHISNRMFDLEPVVAAAADELGWSTLVGEAEGTGDELSSTWVALAPDRASLGTLVEHPDWRSPHEERVAWTDDFSSVLSVLDVS